MLMNITKLSLFWKWDMGLICCDIRSWLASLLRSSWRMSSPYCCFHPVCSQPYCAASCNMPSGWRGRGLKMTSDWQLQTWISLLRATVEWPHLGKSNTQTNTTYFKVTLKNNSGSTVSKQEVEMLQGDIILQSSLWNNALHGKKVIDLPDKIRLAN